MPETLVLIASPDWHYLFLNGRMLELPLTPELECTLAAIAARTDDAPGELARAALVTCLEDLEDYAVAGEGWRANDPS